MALSSPVVVTVDDLEQLLADPPPPTEDPAPPVVDDGGLVRYRDRWVAVPVVQIPVAELFVEHFGELVTVEEIERTYAEAGAATSPAALKAALNRLARRLRPLGLALHRVRGRGHVLDVPDARAA